tara:strand:+ start:552 stop:1259 length:708 start_codon:yes stop_codon:yes gene_type:complete
MKLVFLFLTFAISINSIAQSKKEQIEMLNMRIDSLNKAYVKDTIVLGKAIRKINGEQNVLSAKLDKANAQLNQKSETLKDKSNTIKSLNAKNMELMREIKELRSEQKTLFAKQKALRFSLDSINKMNELETKGVMIPVNAIPFHAILQSESQYDGTWSYEMNFDKGQLSGVSTLYLKSGFEDAFEMACDCPEFESIPEGSRVFGFAIQSTCSFEDVSNGAVITKECYRPLILKKY